MNALHLKQPGFGKASSAPRRWVVGGGYILSPPWGGATGLSGAGILGCGFTHRLGAGSFDWMPVAAGRRPNPQTRTLAPPSLIAQLNLAATSAILFGL